MFISRFSTHTQIQRSLSQKSSSLGLLYHQSNSNLSFFKNGGKISVCASFSTFPWRDIFGFHFPSCGTFPKRQVLNLSPSLIGFNSTPPYNALNNFSDQFYSRGNIDKINESLHHNRLLFSKFDSNNENQEEKDKRWRSSQSLRPSFYQDGGQNNSEQRSSSEFDSRREAEKKEKKYEDFQYQLREYHDKNNHQSRGDGASGGGGSGGGGNYNFNGKKKPFRWETIASLGAFATLLGKSKTALAALKILKMGPLVSMLISSFAYSMVFGPAYGVGMVAQIFIHECGHLLAMRHYKVPFSPMVFIPFLGASIEMKKMPRNAYEEAIIALGGPVLGTVGAMGFTAAGVMTGHQVLFALANWGYMINLFNLLPIGSLDGGRVADSISPYIGVAGIATGGYLAYSGYITNPIFYLILMFGAYTTGKRLLGYHQAPPHYYNLSRGRQAQIASMYLGLVGVLVTGMTFNDIFRKSPKQIQYEQRHGSSAERPWTGEEEFRHRYEGQGQNPGSNDDYFNMIDEYANPQDDEDEW